MRRECFVSGIEPRIQGLGGRRRQWGSRAEEVRALLRGKHLF